MKSKVVQLNRGRTFVKGGIGSRTIHETCRYRAILFHFDAGQQLSEHTASVPAVMHFLEGRAKVKLGHRTVQAGPGSWVHMPPHLPHAVEAKTRLVMLLTMFTASGEECHDTCKCNSNKKIKKTAKGKNCGCRH